jgi:hypothetical protein
MENLRKRKTSRVTAILLALMMVVVFVPTFAFAADGDEADGITVFMTVSDKGTIAKTKDNEPMAWKEVNVKDLDNSGDYTFDEALVAAHEAYNSADGFNMLSSGWVKSVWGVADNPAGYSFLQNDKATNIVTLAKVNAGDYLVASINQDTELSADWASYFDKKEIEANVGETVKLTLSGFPAMTINPPAKGRNVKVNYTALGDADTDGSAVTDENGEVELTFDSNGIYLVTAEGLVTDTIYSTEDEYGYWGPLGPQTSDADDKPVFGKMDYSDNTSYIGYTEQNYENGPYPYSEIKWLDSEDYDNEEEFTDGFLLYTGDIIYDCPIIAPACIVKVGAKPADVTMTLNDKGVLAKAKDGSAMIEKPVTVKDINCDGKLSYDEALAAAHEAYCANGKAGYSAGMQSSTYGDYFSVTKLWSQDTSNAMFFANGKSTSSVDQAEVVDKDNLYTSINAEPSGRDYLTTFDKTTATVKQYSGLKVNLKGHVGAGYSEDELKDVNLSGIPVGVWKDGKFEKISGVVTDKEGNATVSFDKTGTYILTAKGEFDGTDWYGNPLKCPTMAPYCIVKVTPHVHKLAAVKAKLATAKKAGNTAYWKCAGCGKFFSNAKGTKVIKKNSWVVKKSAMTAKAKTVKAKAKKKTVITKAKAFTVKKAPGKVTFKKLSGNKKITVSKAGKVTVKKGLKKGKTYTVKVKVTSAKTAKYAAISKTVKLKVKITK